MGATRDFGWMECPQGDAKRTGNGQEANQFVFVSADPYYI